MAFLVFEGIDGSGKTTLIKLLAQDLKQRGVVPVLTKEPGGTEVGASIREILLRKTKNPPSPFTELLLYYADRKQNIEERIRPALSKGQWIISDRYWASTSAFQSIAREVDLVFTNTLREKVCKDVEPDLWILLDLPVDVSLKRLKANQNIERDRFELEKKDFHEKVRKAYLQLAQKNKEKWLVLRAEKPSKSLLQDIIIHLKQKKIFKGRDLVSVLMESIKGHDLLKSRLNESIQKNQIPHALLFTGSSGLGKKKTAWAFAQNLLCEDSDLSCGKCFSCLKVEENQSQSVLFLSPKSLEIKLEEVKQIIPFLSLQTSAPAKIVIIDEAHCLNIQSVNFLLKIIEEPPEKSFFIFISPSPSSLPVTLRSRLQMVRFRPLPLSVMRELYPEEEEHIILSSGGRLDLLQELKSEEGLRDMAFDLWEKVSQSEQVPSATSFFLDLNKKRKEALFISRCWQQFLRDVRFFQAGETENLFNSDKINLIKKASLIPSRCIHELFDKTFELERNLLSYLDCVLCFENFMISLQKSLGKR